MPDIDIDFSVNGRDQVINYVADKYGKDRVAQIITFGTMAARAAVRDAGRVLDVPYGTVDRIAKLIPEGPKVYLDDCLKPGSDLQTAVRRRRGRSRASSSSPVRSRVSFARTRSTQRVWSSVIGSLVDYVPLQQKGDDQEVVTQFSMNDIEALGLLKMDFLGLRNLDVIDEAVALVNATRRKHARTDDEAGGAGAPLDIGRRPARRSRRRTRCSAAATRPASSSSSPPACETRYGRSSRPSSRTSSRSSRCSGRGRWGTSRCMRSARPEPGGRLLRRRAPSSRSRRRRTASASTRSSTWRSPSSLGGFSPAEADDLRKAIGKKIHELMASLKDKFIAGCRRANDVSSVRSPTSSGRTWSRRRTTRSTSRTRPATR